MGDIVALAIHHQTENSDYLEQKYGYRRDGKPTEWSRKWNEKWQREREAKDEMRVRCEAAGDMEPFWKAYPEERPEEKRRREIEQAAAYREWEKKWARQAARRANGNGRVHYVTAEEERRSAEACVAQRAGKAGAEKVNLQPFLKGQGAAAKGELV